MDKQTIDTLLQLLSVLTSQSNDHWAKLYAMERMLDLHPELRQEYDKELRLVRQSAAAQTNSESIARAIDNLRGKLLQG